MELGTAGIPLNASKLHPKTILILIFPFPTQEEITANAYGQLSSLLWLTNNEQNQNPTPETPGASK